MVMLDAVLGTPETLEDYKQYLFSWPDPGHRMRVYSDGSTEYLGRVQEDVHPRLDEFLRLRARTLLRDQLGNIDSARDVLRSLASLLDQLDDGAIDDGAGTAQSEFNE